MCSDFRRTVDGSSMASLEKMTPEERTDLCRKYFFIGLAGLPLVWLVNVVWFGHFLRCKTRNEELSVAEQGMKKCRFRCCTLMFLFRLARFADWHCFLGPSNRRLDLLVSDQPVSAC